MRRTKATYSLVNKVPVTLVRKSEGSYVNGRWVEGAETQSTVLVNWQPAKGNDLLMLPESFRTKYVIRVSTTEDFLTLQDGQNQSPDELIINNERFEIHRKEIYSMGVVDHNEYLCSRVEQSAGAS